MNGEFFRLRFHNIRDFQLQKFRTDREGARSADTSQTGLAWILQTSGNVQIDANIERTQQILNAALKLAFRLLFGRAQLEAGGFQAQSNADRQQRLSVCAAGWTEAEAVHANARFFQQQRSQYYHTGSQHAPFDQLECDLVFFVDATAPILPAPCQKTDRDFIGFITRLINLEQIDIIGRIGIDQVEAIHIVAHVFDFFPVDFRIAQPLAA